MTGRYLSSFMLGLFDFDSLIFKWIVHSCQEITHLLVKVESFSSFLFIFCRWEKQFVGGMMTLTDEFKAKVWLQSLNLNYPLQMTTVAPRAKHFKHK